MNPKKIYEVYCEERKNVDFPLTYPDIYYKREKEFGPYQKYWTLHIWWLQIQIENELILVNLIACLYTKLAICLLELSLMLPLLKLRN